MKITYDEDVDVMKITLIENYEIEDSEKVENFIIDFDAGHNVIGIEILNASSIVNKMHKKVN